MDFKSEICFFKTCLQEWKQTENEQNYQNPNKLLNPRSGKFSNKSREFTQLKTHLIFDKGGEWRGSTTFQWLIENYIFHLSIFFLISCGCVTTQAVKQNQKLAGEVETQSYTIVRPLVILLYISTSTNKYSHLHGKNKHQKHVACNVWSLQLLCSVSWTTTISISTFHLFTAFKLIHKILA